MVLKEPDFSDSIRDPNISDSRDPMIIFSESRDPILNSRDPMIIFSESRDPILNSRDPNRVPETP